MMKRHEFIDNCLYEEGEGFDKYYLFQGEKDKRLSIQVNQMMELVKEIIKTKGNLFDQTKVSYGLIRVYCKNEYILRGLADVLKLELWEDLYCKRYFLNANPHVKLLIDAVEFYQIRKSNLEEAFSMFDSDNYELDVNVHMDNLNEFIDYIRQGGKAKEVRKIVRNFKRNANNCLDSVNFLIDQLFERHGTILVIRVDLAYKKELNNLNHIEQMYSQVKADREHLFKNIRSNHNLFGDGYLGYIWKLEYGFFKGFHYHFMFFYNGALVREDITKAWLIGRYWETVITNGRGTHYNCNLNKDVYKYCGIGKIKWNDFEGIANIKRAAQYLTKADYYVKMLAEEGDRTFGRSEPDEFSNIPGRPRHYPIDSVS